MNTFFLTMFSVLLLLATIVWGIAEIALHKLDKLRDLHRLPRWLVDEDDD